MESKHGFRLYAPAVLLILAGFIIAYQFIKPAPPDRVVIASGPAEGGYHTFAMRYARELAREGVTLEVIETAGSVANLRLLNAGDVELAFVQGGVADMDDHGDLESLGSVYYEPLWLFHRDGLEVDRLPALAALRVAIGAEGSGTRELVSRLLHDNGISPDAPNFLTMENAAATTALAAGDIDAAFFVGSPQSPLIDGLLRDTRISIASFERADAYASRYHYLNSLVLPEGVVDLADNIPPRDVRLLAPAANLISHPDLHPAIIDLLLQAAQSVHVSGGWFEQRNEFPKDDLLALPLNDSAARFYKYGPPFLQRFLPFWAASLIDRLKVMLLPLVVLLIPLMKIMPPIYAWRMRSRVYRWYRELEQVDERIGTAADNAPMLADLDRIEDEVRRVNVPLSFAGQLYHLRQHIELVRNKVRRHTPEGLSR